MVGFPEIEFRTYADLQGDEAVVVVDVGLHYKWIALSNSAPRWLRLVCPYGPKENLGLPTCTWCRDGRLDACAHASALRLQLIQTA